LEDFCDDADKPSDSTTAGKVLIIRIPNQLLKKDPVPWRWLLGKLT
jgi:hypothetical protein